MSILYTRTETSSEIILSYKYYAGFYVVFIAFLLAPLTGITEQHPHVLPLSFLAFGVLWIAGFWNANREVKQAMKNGKQVKISGRKFSFTNPFTFTITK